MEDTYKGQVDNPLSLNRYTYVHNNPLKFIDPSGNKPLEFEAGSSERVNSAMLNFEDAALYWAKKTVEWAESTGEVPYDVVHEVVPAEYVEEVKTIVGWIAAGKWGREASDLPVLGLGAAGAGAVAGTIKNTGKTAVNPVAKINPNTVNILPEKNLPSQVTPGTIYLPKYDSNGSLKQVKFYDQYGREAGWVDLTNHNRPNDHTAPHWHKVKYGEKVPHTGLKIDYRTDPNPPKEWMDIVNSLKGR